MKSRFHVRLAVMKLTRNKDQIRDMHLARNNTGEGPGIKQLEGEARTHTHVEAAAAAAP
jgi:hypothetical protein